MSGKGGGKIEIESGSESEDDVSSNILFTVDPKLLHCSLCDKPLQSPLFQCLGNHLVCSPCYTKYEKNCQLCSFPLRATNCWKFEDVLQSIKVICPYSIFGCQETISYTNKPAYVNSCQYSPCSCPIPNCSFKGATRLFSTHLATNHRSYDPTSFSYDDFFHVKLKRDEPFCILQENGGDLFLLLNDRAYIPLGNLISVVCLKPAGYEECDFKYKLSVNGGNGDFLHIKASAVIMKEWKGVYPAKAFLFAPSEFNQKPDYVLGFYVRVRIRKYQVKWQIE